MKHAFFLILIFSLNAFAESDIDHIRSLFDQGIYSEFKAEELKLLLEKKASTPLTTGYMGAVNIILARHAFNPFTKYNYFNVGKVLLELSIQRDPLSPELRYLRMIIQINVPRFLNYRKDLATDKLYLQKYLESNTDSDTLLRLKITHALNLDRQKSLIKN